MTAIGPPSDASGIFEPETKQRHERETKQRHESPLDKLPLPVARQIYKFLTTNEILVAGSVSKDVALNVYYERAHSLHLKIDDINLQDANLDKFAAIMKLKNRVIEYYIDERLQKDFINFLVKDYKGNDHISDESRKKIEEFSEKLKDVPVMECRKVIKEFINNNKYAFFLSIHMIDKEKDAYILDFLFESGVPPLFMPEPGIEYDPARIKGLNIDYLRQNLYYRPDFLPIVLKYANLSVEEAHFAIRTLKYFPPKEDRQVSKETLEEICSLLAKKLGPESLGSSDLANFIALDSFSAVKMCLDAGVKLEDGMLKEASPKMADFIKKIM